VPSSPGNSPEQQQQRQPDKDRCVEEILQDLEKDKRKKSHSMAIGDFCNQIGQEQEESNHKEGSILFTFSSSSSSKTAITPAKRQRVEKAKTSVLNQVFKVERMPSQCAKQRLAAALGMSYKQIQIWFQNKRARCKLASWEAPPPRSFHTFHNTLVSSDGRYLRKELVKSQPQPHHHTPQLQQQGGGALPPAAASHRAILSIH